jgi:UPF0042 nucleotide-binding protein
MSPRATRPLPPENASRFVVLSGLSGAGKSQALNALEDLGFFCVDNLPITLMPALAELALRAGPDIAKVAVIVDVREGAMLRQFPAVYRRLHATAGLNPVLIFLDAREKALVRRYSETRRPHPLAPTSSAIEGIRAERQRLAPIRKIADQIVDTTDMTVHELRQAFLAISRGGTRARGPVVTIQSFGFKHGLPVDADLVFDVRFLPNPHFQPALRGKTGRDREVVRFLDRAPETHEFLTRGTALLAFLLPQYAKEGKSYVTVAVGCTGGKHRSVALAEAMKRELGALEGIRLRVRHRDIASE